MLGAGRTFWEHTHTFDGPGKVGVVVRPDPEAPVSVDPTPLDEALVTERELWQDGPPHELFKRLRAECPVHWTARITEYPEEDGFWSVTTAESSHLAPALITSVLIER